MQDESLRKVGKETSDFFAGWLFADGSRERFIGAATAAYVNPQALDFLIQRGERDHKTLGGFRLIPAGALEHVHNDAALDLVHDLKERGLRMIGAGTGARFARQRWKKFRELKTDTADDFLAANAFRKQIDVDTFLRGKYDGALDDIFQLANVAGPIVVHQEFHCTRRKLAHRLGVLQAIAREEVSEQRGDVFPAIAQRGQLEMNYIQAVVQVLAEAALADKRQQFNVGSSNDADINFEL